MHAPASHTCGGGLTYRPHARFNAPRSAFRCSPALQRACRRAQVHRHVTAAASTDQLPELTQELRAVIRSREPAAGFPPDALPLLEKIDSAVQEQGIPQITAEGIRGRFREVLNNTSFVDADGTLTLGVFTFNQFQPKDLKLKLRGVDLLQGIEAPDQYSTEATFEVIGGELDGVQGVQKTLGRYEITGEKPGRQDVYFSGVAIFPKHPEDSERWVAALKEHNPCMDDNGRAEIQFPGSAAHGFRDFRIIEDDLVLSVGNRKSFVCVQPVR